MTLLEYKYRPKVHLKGHCLEDMWQIHWEKKNPFLCQSSHVSGSQFRSITLCKSQDHAGSVFLCVKENTDHMLGEMIPMPKMMWFHAPHTEFVGFILLPLFYKYLPWNWESLTDWRFKGSVFQCCDCNMAKLCLSLGPWTSGCPASHSDSPQSPWQAEPHAGIAEDTGKSDMTVILTKSYV